MKLLLIASLIIGGLAGNPANDRPDQLVRPSAHQTALSAYQRMTPAERVGQLFMAGEPSSGTSHAERVMLRTNHIGNVILDANTTESIKHVHHANANLASKIAVTTVRPFISTDQEGGLVQRLQGHGFSAIPTALAQGRLSPHQLRTSARTWGSQLRRAGVNLDLAPVADTVPAQHARRNQPIGASDREFGHTPKVVSSHVTAFVRGMRDAGEAVTVKHFPGLGRASGNTDLSRHVTDPTTRHDSYLRPFQSGVSAGAEFVMVSSATYPHIDPTEPACFSHTILHGMLRGDLGFRGVVISDDAGAVALSGTPLGKRATKFFVAGGTMLLDTSPNQLPTMIAAVMKKQSSHAWFASTVKADVITVLTAKAKAGLISSS